MAHLCEAALSEVKAHSTCWATVLDAPIYDGPRARTTLKRWHQVHDLLNQGVGLLECARRLELALNTVKRYARADRPERMLRVPKYRASLVDPYREHLRKRRVENPAFPLKHLFEEIKALGYEGCLNLLHKYINQGRADADRSHISARRLTRMLLTRPDNLKSEHHDLLARLTATCPEMTQLAAHIADFAQLLTPREGNADRLSRWIAQVRATDLPHLHSFPRPGPRPARNDCRAHASVQQRPHRGRQHQNQADRAPDARTSRLYPPPPPHPPRIAAHSVTTECGTGPFIHSPVCTATSGWSPSKRSACASSVLAPPACAATGRRLLPARATWWWPIRRETGSAWTQRWGTAPR